MTKGKSVLITGITGFIGQGLRQYLINHGYEVWGISSRNSNEARIIQGDLLSMQETIDALSKIPLCPTVVHAAALTNSGGESLKSDYLFTNMKMTENLIKALEGKKLSVIFLSSVAVYGQDGREKSVTVSEELKPSNNYGLSKLKCEELIQNSQISDYYILRLGPVFNESNLEDIKKRVYFPGQNKIKIYIKPSPSYSLCHTDTLFSKILGIIEGNANAPKIMNLVDPVPYKQNQLAKQFNGIGIPCPLIFLMPFYYMLHLLPSRYGYPLKCFFGKLFKNNIYE